jgi:hypothetical protein
MVLVAVLAIDFAVLPTFQHVPSMTARIGLFGALPMAHVLAVYLAIVVSSLVRRGEVALSRVTFLMSGGTAILLFVATLNLAPQLFFEYISNTAGLWVRSGENVPAVFFLGMGGIRLIEALLVCGVVTPLLLVPALLTGWATRGYRLKLVKGPESEGD